MKGFAGFWYGATLPFRAAGMILRNPSLIVLSIFPFLLTVIAYAVGLAWLSSVVPRPESQEWAKWLTVVLTWLFLIAIGVTTFSTMALIVCTPFNDFLAERAEKYCDPQLIIVGEISFSTRVRLIAIDVVKTLFGAGIAGMALMLSWIPGLNILALLLSCWVMSFQFLSYPQTRRSEGLLAGVTFIGNYPAATLGFGAAFVVLFSVPFLGCFALPMAVVGGTQLYARHRSIPRAYTSGS